MSPKQRLLAQKPLCEDIGRMLASSQFELAADTARLEFQDTISFSNTGEGAIAGFYMQQGALRFLDVLKKIALAPGELNPNRFGQLDHEMKMPEKEKK